MNSRSWICLALVGVLTTLPHPLEAATDSVDLQRALDKPIDLEVSDAPIADLLDRIERAAGVKIVLEGDAVDALPYGAQTRLAVTLKNVTLRSALTPLLGAQALQWEIEGDAIHVRPTEGLYRLSRRATFAELSTLGAIYSQTLQSTRKGGAVMEQLRKVSGNDKLRLLFHAETDPNTAHRRAERALPGTPASYLDMLTHGTKWTWVLRGNDIVVIDRVSQIERQLKKKVSLRYQNMPLVSILLDLVRKGRVKLTLAPGVLNYLGPNTHQNFSLMMADASIAQALQVIRGATGLEFVRTPDGLRVEASEQLKSETQAKPTRGRQRARFFVRMTIPGPEGSQIEVFLRPEELPQDVLERIEKEKERFIRRLRADAELEESAREDR